MSIKRKENSNRYRPLSKEAKGMIFLETGITLSDKDASYVAKSAGQRRRYQRPKLPGTDE